MAVKDTRFRPLKMSMLSGQFIEQELRNDEPEPDMAESEKFDKI